jgi:hypothetical protein
VSWFVVRWLCTNFDIPCGAICLVIFIERSAICEWNFEVSTNSMLKTTPFTSSDGDVYLNRNWLIGIFMIHSSVSTHKKRCGRKETTEMARTRSVRELWLMRDEDEGKWLMFMKPSHISAAAAAAFYSFMRAHTHERWIFRFIVCECVCVQDVAASWSIVSLRVALSQGKHGWDLLIIDLALFVRLHRNEPDVYMSWGWGLSFLWFNSYFLVTRWDIYQFLLPCSTLDIICGRKWNWIEDIEDVMKTRLKAQHEDNEVHEESLNI